MDNFVKYGFLKFTINFLKILKKMIIIKNMRLYLVCINVDIATFFHTNVYDTLQTPRLISLIISLNFFNILINIVFICLLCKFF